MAAQLLAALARARQVGELAELVGAAALSATDQLYLDFATQFEQRVTTSTAVNGDPRRDARPVLAGRLRAAGPRADHASAGSSTPTSNRGDGDAADDASPTRPRRPYVAAPSPRHCRTRP